MQHVDWKRLFVFSKTAEAGSIAKAADLLHFSSSALSRQIRALEKEVGCLLFKRESRGLVLTQAGSILYKTTQEVATSIASTEMRLLENKTVPCGLIRVEVTYILGTFWLPQRLLEFSAHYPDIYFKILFTEGAPDFSSKKADISISLFSPANSAVVCAGPIRSPTGVYASQAYLERYGVPKKISHLDNHRLLILKDVEVHSPFVSHWNWLLEAEKAGLPPRQFSFACNSLQGLYYATKHHVGIAQLPKFCVRPEDQLVELFLNIEKPQVARYVLCPKEALSLRRVALFRNFIVEQLIAYFAQIN